MANTFLRKVSRNVGNTAVTVGSYTVGANIGAVVVGLSVSNTTGSEVRANVVINNGSNDYYLVKSAPILDSSTLILVGNEQKIVLQTGDSVKVTSSDGPSLDVLMTVMETEGVGITVDSVGITTVLEWSTDYPTISGVYWWDNNGEGQIDYPSDLPIAALLNVLNIGDTLTLLWTNSGYPTPVTVTVTETWTTNGGVYGTYHDSYIKVDTPNPNGTSSSTEPGDTITVTQY